MVITKIRCLILDLKEIMVAARMSGPLSGLKRESLRPTLWKKRGSLSEVRPRDRLKFTRERTNIPIGYRMKLYLSLLGFKEPYL